MENLIDIIAKIAAALLAIGIAWLSARAKQFITTKATEADNKFVLQLVETFTEAAEQQLKADDPDGTKRKEYVQEQLVAAGVEVTEIINAAIEAAVYRINSKEA